MIVDSCGGEMIGVDRVNQNQKVKRRRTSRKSKTKAKCACNECASRDKYMEVTFDSEMKASVKRCVYFLSVQ